MPDIHAGFKTIGSDLLGILCNKIKKSRFFVQV